MDYYRATMAGTPKGRQLFDLFGPGNVLADMDSINSAVASLSRDIAGAPVKASFKADYALWAADWRNFYDQNRGSWLSRSLNRTDDQVRNYASTLADWAAQFRAAGGTITPLVTGAGQRAKNASLWPWVVGGGVALLGVWWLFNHRRQQAPTVVHLVEEGVAHG